MTIIAFPPDYLYACHSEDFMTSSGQRGSAFTRGLNPVVAIVPVANTEGYVVTRQLKKKERKGVCWSASPGKEKGSNKHL